MAPDSTHLAQEETHDKSYETVLKDINGTIYNNVQGFHEKYFQKKPWSSKAERVAWTASRGQGNERQTQFPSTPTGKSFLEWFSELKSKSFGGRSTFYTSWDQPPHDQNLPSVFLVPTGLSKTSNEYSWADFLVVAEVSRDASSYRQYFLRLCEHAQKVFKSQPTRRFVHSFYVHGSTAELWVFDRSGPYGCEAFDIRKELDRFIIVTASYTEMSDEELGINTFIKKDEQRQYVMVKGENKADMERIYLEDQPIAFAPDIVSSGTAAYRAKRIESNEWEFVVKFTWRSDHGLREVDMLRFIKERNVWGVVQLFGHVDLDSIDRLRRGLEFSSPRMVPPKVSKSSDKTQSPADTSNLAVGDHVQSVIDKCAAEAKLAGLDDKKDSTFVNRVFSCIVVHPPGRAVDKFKSIPEFLGAFSDIIKGLRSLYQDGRILHQDVSKGNLMITDVHKRGDPRGFLIDLEAAKLLDDTDAKEEITGTKLFMAIGVLKAKPHTYRHDLESLFYCLLWIASTHGLEGLPKDSLFYRWVHGSFDDCAQEKSNDMGESEFDHIVSGFTSEFKGLALLARELRNIMFPNQDELLFKGSNNVSESPDIVYNQMINAFERTIEAYEQYSQATKLA
ncbi:conserved hypothetical protein [Microsporum canis CBS 113480]|uniref:non-specific serine/threonine protein kinase n=1 Tax=Arthroderma otae (strain ATCC MYA-4605 / CBS 113480) TaxID=554155 RepID=C5FIK6_ARTOC|nr:conserved hypothetical protein [Microsporum canis CBS 113480]EEQ29275.1 conserved hypothetical protein [Microsporum canis CBS 113480]